MKILMLGAAGFIGSHAVDHFVECGDEVMVYDKLTYAGSRNSLPMNHIEFVKGDVTDALHLRSVASRGFDVILNFAAESHVDTSIVDSTQFVKTNFEGACNAMTTARVTNALYCHVSTDEVYGAVDEDNPRAFETWDALKPRNPYSASKASADLMLHANRITHGQEFLCFRPSNNFGPRQHTEKFLPKLIDAMIFGKEIGVYGDGKQVREWTYAPDTVRIMRARITDALFVHKMNKPVHNEIINITSGVSETNIDMIARVERCYRELGIIPNHVVKHVTDRPGHDRRYWIKDSTGMSHTNLDAALKTTIWDYYQKHA